MTIQNQFPNLVIRVNFRPSSVFHSMEDGTKSKKTVFVGGIPEEADEAVLYEHFSAFGAFGIFCEFLM